MKTTITTCDIDNCENEGAKTVRMQVIFHTEQTEGRVVKPYFSMCEIDLCEVCREKILKSKKYIEASGAMGHNTYSL